MAYALRFSRDSNPNTMELIVAETGDGVDCHVMTEVESEQTLADVATRWSLIYGPIPQMLIDIRVFLGRPDNDPNNWHGIEL